MWRGYERVSIATLGYRGADNLVHYGLQGRRIEDVEAVHDQDLVAVVGHEAFAPLGPAAWREFKLL